MKRKYISLLLVLCMLAPFALQASATNTVISHKATSQMVKIGNRDAFAEAFALDTAIHGTKDNASPNVEYTYSITPGTYTNKANVELNFTLSYSQYTFQGVASGSVDAMELTDHTVLWEGPLDGMIRSNDLQFDIIVGFAAIADKAQFTITIKNVGQPIILFCGESILTGNIYDKLKTQTLDRSDMPASQSSIDGSYTKILGSDITEGFSGGLSGDALTSTAYFNGATRLAISTMSYTNNLKNALLGTDMISVQSYIAEYSLELKRGPEPYGGSSAILNIQCPNSIENDLKSGNEVSVLSLVKDILNALGLPDSVISQLFSDKRGKFNISSYSDQCQILATFSAQQNMRFDTSPGFPIVFQLLKTNDKGPYIGGSIYQFTTSLRYRSLCVDQYDAMYFVYTDTKEANRTVTLDLK